MLVKSVHASAQMLQWLPISELNTTILLWPICLQVTCPAPISCSRLTTFSYAPARLASFLTIKQPQQAAHLGSLPILVSLPDALHPDGHIFFFSLYSGLCSNTILLEKTFLITYMKEHKPSPHLALFFLWHLLPLT